MSADGVLFRDGSWVDISDYNRIIKIFIDMGYDNMSMNVKEGAICWNPYLLNEEIINKNIEDDNYDDVTGTVIIYFYWIEKYPQARRIIEGIEQPVSHFLYIEDIYERGLILLEFLHRYFEHFPTDVFWESGGYYYNKEDIDKMYKKSEPDKFWMFKDPVTF